MCDVHCISRDHIHAQYQALPLFTAYNIEKLGMSLHGDEATLADLETPVYLQLSSSGQRQHEDPPSRSV